MKGIILINAFSTNEEYLYQPNRLQEEFLKLGVTVDIKRNNYFPCIVEKNDLKNQLQGYDFCIFYDKDKYILNALASLNVPLFNPPDAIANCDDKMVTYLALTNQNIPMPKTLPGLLCYTPEEPLTEEIFLRIESELNYPLIIKESYGSLGKGVYLVNDRKQLVQILEEVKCKPYLCQQFINTSYGKDVRVMVIGGKVLGAMLRSSEGDFRSNLGAGGSGIAYPLNQELIELSQKIAKILNLEYCGIDFLFGENNKPIVCEVNSNAFFYGFENCTNINVAKAYAEHILTKLNA